MNRCLPEEETALFKGLKSFGIHFEKHIFLDYPLYEAVEYLARGFGLLTEIDVYVSAFLELTHEVSKKRLNDLASLLEHWETEKEKLSVSRSEAINAVRIMTIHKAKGLEFPVTICPYANDSLEIKMGSKLWIPIDKEAYADFEEAYVPVSKQMHSYGAAASEAYDQLAEQSYFDGVNLLYVATTRPVERLYVFGKKTKSEKRNTISGLLIDFLKAKSLWNEEQKEYVFGKPLSKKAPSKAAEASIALNTLISTPKEAHDIKILARNGLLWDTSQQEAIEKGNLIHNLLAKIIYANDVSSVVQHAVSDGIIESDDSARIEDTLQEVVRHPQLALFFSEEFRIYNEREVITAQGELLRPDRIVMADRTAIIIDYKTGAFQENYLRQMSRYSDAVEAMGYSVSKKLLVFIGKEIEVHQI